MDTTYKNLRQYFLELRGEKAGYITKFQGNVYVVGNQRGETALLKTLTD